jgi:hypothetical protein
MHVAALRLNGRRQRREDSREAYFLVGSLNRKERIALSTSHRQNDAELCVAAYHARVSLGRFFKGICFNHGMHAG